MSFIENIGSRVISSSLFTYDFFVFLFRCLGNMFLVRNYGKSSRIFLIKQIYLSSLENLFSFLFLALFFGSILIVIAISFAINFNLVDQIGNLLVLLIINEFSPFFTTLFFMFVYTLSLAQKVSSIKSDKASLNNKFYIPALINGIFIVPLMALLFATIMIASGYIISYFYLSIDLVTYKSLIISSISFENILILFIKSLAFGFISIFVPIYFGHNREKNSFNITGTVVKILIIILSMLLLTEFLSILIFY